MDNLPFPNISITGFSEPFNYYCIHSQKDETERCGNGHNVTSIQINANMNLKINETISLIIWSNKYFNETKKSQYVFLSSGSSPYLEVALMTYKDNMISTRGEIIDDKLNYYFEAIPMNRDIFSPMTYSICFKRNNLFVPLYYTKK